MRSLLITLEYPPMIGGVSNYYQNIHGHWPDNDGLNVLDNSKKQLVNNGLILFKWLPSVYNLYFSIKKYKLQHIFVGQILPLGYSAYLMKKILNTDYSVFIHGMDYAFAQRTGRKKRTARKILFMSKNIICSNHYVADLIAKDHPNLLAKIIVANPGVAAPNEFQRFELSDFDQRLKNKKIILTIARLVKRKGMDNVIKAMSAVSKRFSDAVYVIAGEGTDRSYLEELSLELKDKVIFLGKISDYQKWFLLQQCDFFIMTSRNIQGDFEGFGIVYLEANLCRKPVIAGNEGGESDAVANGHSGILVDPRNTEEIAEAMVKLLSDDDLRSELGEKSRKRAIEKFNWDNIVNDLYIKLKI